MDKPSLAREGWTLESAVSRSESAPDTFLIPGEVERKSVLVGQGAKLLFWIHSESEQGPVCERMWVRIEERLGDGRYAGTLASTPTTPGKLEEGQRLIFGPEHIAEIYAGPTG